MNPSIVDYLNSKGQASDYTTRAALAAKNGITGYTGSAAQNTQLLSLLNKPTTPIVPQATPPINAASVTQTPQANLPTPNNSTPGTSGVGGLVSYYQSQFETAQKQATDYKSQQEKLQTTQDLNKSSILSLLSQNPNQTATNTATAATGIDPTQYFASEKAQIAEISTLNDEYTKAVQARDQQIAQTNDKLASNDFINNQVAQINRNAAPVLNALSANINSKAAALQASQGMFSEAQNYIKQAVDAATADYKDRYDGLVALYDANQSAIDSLDTKYSSALKDATEAAKTIYTQQLDEKSKIGDLMVANPQAGISITDTLDQAMTKVGLKPKTTSTTVGSADGGYTNVVKDSQGNVVSTTPITGTGGGNSANFTTSQLNKGANNAGLTSADFNKLPKDIQNFYISSTATQIKGINAEIAAANDGSKTADEVIKEIDGSNQTDATKTYLKGLIKTQSGQSKGWWQSVKDFVGGLF